MVFSPIKESGSLYIVLNDLEALKALHGGDKVKIS